MNFVWYLQHLGADIFHFASYFQAAVSCWFLVLGCGLPFAVVILVGVVVAIIFVVVALVHVGVVVVVVVVVAIGALAVVVDIE